MQSVLQRRIVWNSFTVPLHIQNDESVHELFIDSVFLFEWTILLICYGILKTNTEPTFPVLRTTTWFMTVLYLNDFIINNISTRLRAYRVSPWSSVLRYIKSSHSVYSPFIPRTFYLLIFISMLFLFLLLLLKERCHMIFYVRNERLDTYAYIYMAQIHKHKQEIHVERGIYTPWLSNKESV